MSNIVSYKKEAREELKKGVKMLSDIVGSTLGAAGRSVIIDNTIGDPFVTADGVTVAQNLSIDATFPGIGVNLVKNVAINTNNVAGDGTTTSVVLANAMLQNDEIVEGKSPILVKKGIEIAVEKIKKWLDKKAKKVKSEKDLINIATISARGDSEMGCLIAKAYEHTGKEGQILVEEGRDEVSDVEFITGYSIDSGYWHEAFCNNQKRKIVEYENPLILVSDFMFFDINDLARTLNIAAEEKRPLVIIGGDIAESVVRVIIQNVVQGAINATYIEAPEVGSRQSAILEDLAFYTSSKYLSQHLGDKAKDINLSNLGTCEKFISYGTASVFLNSGVDKEKVETYIKELPPITEDEDFNTKRVSRLSGRLSKIKVGATTSVEMREKRDRVEDAVNATRAAIEQGYIAGGGITLLHASIELDNSSHIKDENVRAGYDLVIKSIRSPLYQILTNLYGEFSIDLETKFIEVIGMSYPNGIDAKTQKTVNMYRAGIIDPVKVTKTALESSSSVVSTILNTNGIIAIVGDSGKLSLD